MIFGIDTDLISAIFISGFMLFVLIKTYVKAIKRRRAALEELEKPIEKSPLRFEKARVLAKRTDIIYSKGKKIPTHKNIFFVTFSVDGVAKELEVPQEIFADILVNKSATLVTKNGSFYDFGDFKSKSN